MPNEKYLIVRDGKFEHLLGLADLQSRLIASSASRLDLYAALVKDAGLPLVDLDCGGAVVTPTPTQTQARAQPESDGGVCGWCHQQRIKDGKLPDGRQRWRCPQPHNQRQEQRSARAVRRGSGKRVKRGGRDFAHNPNCPNCHKPLNITGRHKGVTYYKCKQGCPARGRGEGWSSLNLPSTDGQARNVEAIVRKRVESCNHHDPAIRDDVIQEIMLDLESHKLSVNDLDNERIRGYIRSQQRLRSNPHRDISIDAPVGQSTKPLAEVIEG